MRYEKPATLSLGEIRDILKGSDVPPKERVNAVLSAIFHSESAEGAGDILIEEFSTAEYVERKYLRNLFETFYQSWGTTHRIDESVLLLRRYQADAPNEAAATAETIDALLEYKVIFESA